MKTTMHAVVAAIAMLLATSARGEEYRWTGGYVGLQGSWVDSVKTGELFYEDINVMGPAGTEVDLGTEGFLGGALIGYTYQMSALVIGAEADISFGSVEGSQLYTMPGGAYKWQIESQLNMLATARAKLGLALGPVLIYGTGGVAFADFAADKEVTSNDGHPWSTTALDHANDNHVGLVYGAGVEWQITKNLTVKGEYLRADFGKEDGLFSGTAYPGTPSEMEYSSDSYSGDIQMDIVRAGLNYRF